MKKSINTNSKSGYVAISIVLVLTVVLLGIIITVARLGIGEGQVSLALTKSEGTLHFVEGCMEDALQKIQSNPLYAGGTIAHPEGTCSVTVSSVESTYTVTTSATNTSYNRTIQVVASRGASLILTSWKEL